MSDFDTRKIAQIVTAACKALAAEGVLRNDLAPALGVAYLGTMLAQEYSLEEIKRCLALLERKAEYYHGVRPQ